MTKHETNRGATRVQAHSHHSSDRVYRFMVVPVLAVLSMTSRAAEPMPSAQDILAGVRMQQARQQIDLQGQLRQDALIVPFRLVQDGAVVRYLFSNPTETLLLKLGQSDSDLEDISDEGVKKVALFNGKVRGTNVSYEDLALKFLYWSKAQVVGAEKVQTRDCWKLELRPPSRQSQYSSVLLWTDKNSGALMRLDGYDWNGQLAKRFEVISAQKIDNRWFLKQMRIEAFQPGTTHVLSRTYLEIKR